MLICLLGDILEMDAAAVFVMIHYGAEEPNVIEKILKYTC